MCRVLTGQAVNGVRGTCSKNLPEGVHSSVDNIHNPLRFVVYNDAAAYPEYVIKWHMIDDNNQAF